MSDEPRYEPIDDLPPDEAAGPEQRPARLTKSVLPISKGMPKKAVSPTPSKAPEPMPPISNAPAMPTSFRLSVALPDNLIERIKAARTVAGIAGEVVGDVTLATVQTNDESGLREAVRRTEQAHLPLSMKLVRVQATVSEQQRYAAGWQIAPEADYAQLRADLLDAVQADLETRIPFAAWIGVGEDVAAKTFPALVAALQRVFEPFAWKIEQIGIEPLEGDQGTT